MLKNLKKYKRVGIISLVVILGVFVLSIFNSLGLPMTVTSIIDMLIGVCLIFYLGYSKGIKRDKKGYIAGLKYGLIVILSLFVISVLIFKVNINIVMIIYYLSLLIATVIGSMYGINKKKND